MRLKDGQVVEGVEVEWINAEYSSSCTIFNCTVGGFIYANHSNNCTVEDCTVEWLDAENSNNFTIENCTIEWCINADHSNNCIIKNCTVGGFIYANHSNNCTVEDYMVTMWLYAEHSNDCTVKNCMVELWLYAEYSSGLQTYNVKVGGGICIDEELFNLINLTHFNMETQSRLHPSFKELCLANKEKVRVQIEGVYFNWDEAEKLSLRPQEYTKQDLLDCNQEKMRIIADRLGDHFMEIMDFEVVHEDEFGILKKTTVNGDEMYVVEVVCPSKSEDKPYYLPVPANLEQALDLLENFGAPKDTPWWNEKYERAIWPEHGEMRTAKQAVAWTFARKEEEYNPIIQT